MELKFGFSLDTRGIREAIYEKSPEKARLSDGLIDVFDQVDEPLMKFTATIGIGVEASAAIVKIGAEGKLRYVGFRISSTRICVFFSISCFSNPTTALR